ncbi:unnamed protein product [Closterium sp. Naga37s-1]|nr:unnamed protein product [Closterium sp. Naga37s-1]
MEDITYGSWSKQPKEQIVQQLQQATMGFEAEEEWHGEETATAHGEEGAAELPVIKGVEPTGPKRNPLPQVVVSHP